MTEHRAGRVPATRGKRPSCVASTGAASACTSGCALSWRPLKWCPPGTPFPGDIPGKRGSCFNLPDGRRVSIRKHGQGKFWVRVPWTEDEVRAHEAGESHRAMLEKTARDLEEARRRVGRMKQSADEYRSEAAKSAAMLLLVITKLADGTAGTVVGGYRLDRDGVAKVIAHTLAILEAFRTERVVFDTEQNQSHREWCAREVRANDPAFVAMLGGLSGAAS